MPVKSTSTEAELRNRIEQLQQQVSELTQANSSLEQVDQVIHQSSDFEELMQSFLQEALQIFDTDRAWLLYPCDPEAPSWQVLMECSRAEYPGAFVLNTDLPMLPEAAEAFQCALDAEGPVCYDPSSHLSLPAESARLFSIQSQITLAIYPPHDKPWLFGMHQCSYPRVWSENDCQLFEQVGRRLPEGFSPFLTHRQLEESERKFKSLVANIPGTICRRGIDNDWTVSYLSEGIERLTGYPASDFIANQLRTFASIIHPEDFQMVHDSVRHAIDRQTFFELEYRLLTRSGQVVWVHERGQTLIDPQGKQLYLDSAIFDITEKKTAETDLLRLQQLLSDIINAMPAAVISTDENGRVNQWNCSAENLSGIREAEAINVDISALLPALYRKHPDLYTVLTEGRVVEISQFHWRHNDQDRCKEISAFPFSSNGKICGAVLRIEDIHDRLQMEQALIQADKMLSVGTLAAGMAHEINNPLAGILQSLQVVRNRFSASLEPNRLAAERAATSLDAINSYLQDRQIDKLLDSAISFGTRAAQIVNNLLSFSRKVDSGMMKCSVPDLLDHALALAEREFQQKNNYDFKTIRLERDFAPGLSTVRCASNQLQQVFLNLFNNSARAIVQQMARLSASDRHAYLPKISIRVTEQDNWLRIEISDNGCGMDESVRKRLFEPFFTTREPGEGTGLGLAICYFIVTENHAGRLNVESTPELGTSVRIELPIDLSATEQIPS